MKEQQAEKIKQTKNLIKDSHYLDDMNIENPMSVPDFAIEWDKLRYMPLVPDTNNPLFLLFQSLITNKALYEAFAENNLSPWLFEVPTIDPAQSWIQNSLNNSTLMFLCYTVVKTGGFNRWNNSHMSDRQVAEYWIEYMLQNCKNNPFAHWIAAAYYIDIKQYSKARKIMDKVEIKAKNMIRRNRNLEYIYSLLMGHLCKGSLQSAKDIDKGIMLLEKHKVIGKADNHVEYSQYFILDPYEHKEYNVIDEEG